MLLRISRHGKMTSSSAYESSASVVPGLHTNERAELIALRRENRQIKLERDILAKGFGKRENY
jgi:transposase-like protein